jgi:hypothetical protein
MYIAALMLCSCSSCKLLKDWIGGFPYVSTRVVHTRIPPPFIANWVVFMLLSSCDHYHNRIGMMAVEAEIS